jgi:hypothetical protein
MKSPAELLLGQQEFKLPPRVFGCVCFVKDYRPLVGKLDPQAVKCIFVGYSSTQKGYKCWEPVGRKLFVSMDVTFQEFEPYYVKKGDLDQFLEEFSSVNESDSREGENDCEHSSGDNNAQGEIVGTISSPQVDGVMRTVDASNDDERGNVEDGDVMVDNERSDVVDDEVVVVGTIPCSTNTSGEIGDKKEKKREVKSNQLYIREGELRLRERKLSYHNCNMLTLQSQFSPQMPLHQPLQAHQPRQKPMVMYLPPLTM